MLSAEISQEIAKLYQQGINLIPVDAVSKNPIVKHWKQVPEIQMMDLLDSLDENRAVAMVCGKRSGNLVVLDIDTKHCKGFDAILFEDIKHTYPHLWKKFRIEQTPSGGYHLIYRIELEGNECPKSVCIAWKKNETEIKSVDEIGKETEKIKISYAGIIEFKCEESLCQSFPSPNYKRIRGDKLEVLSYSEHQSIYHLCRKYNEKVIEENPIRILKDVRDYYEVTPYDAFDKSIEGSLVLTDVGVGWEYSFSSGNYDLFNKSKNKKYEIGATFNKKNRFFKIHTTNYELEDKSYTPSSLYGQLKGLNKKELKTELENKGYGIINKNTELNIIKSRIISEKEMPPNLSDEGKKIAFNLKEKYDSNYPHGIFWKKDEKGNVEISQKGIDDVVFDMQYKYHNGKIYKIACDNKQEYLLVTKTEGELFHSLLTYIKDEDIKDVYDEYSKYIIRFGKLIVDRLKEFGKIPEERLIISSKFVSYKFYLNCYVSITKEEKILCDYSELGDKLVFEDKIIKRNFTDFINCGTINEKSKMFEFLNLAIGCSLNLYETIGYLTHEFLDDSMNSIIIASEKCKDPKKGGGSGKNLLFNILNHATSVHVIDGMQLELKNSLLQSFGGENILVLSDVAEDFNFLFFKNFSSGTSSLKRLYENVVILKRSQMPKPVVLTNYSWKMVSGLERRIIPLEFNEFFSKIKGGVATYFEMMFPSYDTNGDWNDEDWNDFDNLIIHCIGCFLKAGQLLPIELSNGGWEKQFIHTHKEQTLVFIQENIENFVSMKKVTTEFFEELYKNYCWKNAIQDKYKKSSPGMNSALEDYCKYKKIAFEKNKKWREKNSVGVVTGKWFYDESDDCEIEIEEKIPF